ncbi:MAG: glycogen synthase, partial [Bacillota bacterium]
YGTLPVAHATGGLVDTIIDAKASSRSGTGFLFRQMSAAALVAAVKRAVEAYRDGARWRTLQANAMAQDFGWESSAREYAAIFERVAKR